MNIPDSLLPNGYLWAANALALLALLIATLRAPWHLLRRSDLQNLFMGTTIALMTVWSIKTGIKPGLNFHLLGSTLLTLMFGPWLALEILALVLLGITVMGAAGWISLGINFVLMAMVPVALSHAIFRLADSQLPNHFFVYIFVNAFLGAGLAMLACGFSAGLVLRLAGSYAGHYLGTDFLPYFILMGWSEAMTSGMLMTLMVVYRPTWVCTFSNERYLKTKP